MTRATESALDRLERELDRTDDPEERKAILAEIRELSRDLAAEEAWHEQGRENGWE